MKNEKEITPYEVKDMDLMEPQGMVPWWLIATSIVVIGGVVVLVLVF